MPPTVPDLVLEPSVVFVLEGGSLLRKLLDSLAQGTRWQTESVPCIAALRGRGRATSAPRCLVLDASQLESEDFLPRRWPTDIPVICVVDIEDVALSVCAMKAGAADVLTRPVGGTALLEAVLLALNRSGADLRGQIELDAMRRCYASLTPRERDVMALVASGMMNKHVAHELAISEITVKAHRGRVMRKMQAESLATLVKIAARLDLAQGEPLVPPARLAPPATRGGNSCEDRRSGYLP